MKRVSPDVRRNPKRLCRRTINGPETPRGLFDTLPQEMTQLLLTKYCTPESLTALSKTSKSMCTYLRDLSVDTNLFINPLARWISDKKYSLIKRQFREIGNFLRGTSAYLSVTEKLGVMEAFLYQLEKTYHKICEELGLRFAYDCIGVMLYRFINNWNDSSLVKAFLLIERLSRLKERVDKVLSSDPGSLNLQHYERDVRQFIKEVFLNKSVTKDQHALWLQQVMELFPDKHARLIYLLYGPLENSDIKTTGMVDWEMMCCCASYHTGCPYSHFREMAETLKLMAESRRFDWSETMIIDFFNKLTNMPEKWCLENCAKLMYLIGKEFTVNVLKTKLRKEEVQEFSHISYHLAQVSSEQSKEATPHCLEWFIDVMIDCLGVYQVQSKRSYVIGEVFSAWTDNIQALTEVLQDPLEEDDVQDDIRSSFTNLAAMTHLLWMRVYMLNKNTTYHISQNEE